MRLTKLPQLVLAAALLLTVAVAGAANVPALKARVTDLTRTLDATQISAVEAKLAAFEQKKGSQIAVLLVPTTEPDTIEQYGIRVAEQWKLGRKGVDDGALLLIAKNDKQLRIEVGRGLEGVIPDAIAKRIIAEHIVPRFKQGDFAGGIDAGVERMIKLVDGEPLPAVQRSTFGVPQNGRFDQHMGWALLLLMIFSGILRWLLGAVLGGIIVGVAAGALAAWMGATLLIAGVVGFLAFLATLIGITNLGGMVSGGGGGGGWGGGGGDFGGGGASGRW